MSKEGELSYLNQASREFHEAGLPSSQEPYTDEESLTVEEYSRCRALATNDKFLEDCVKVWRYADKYKVSQECADNIVNLGIQGCKDQISAMQEVPLKVVDAAIILIQDRIEEDLENRTVK